MSEKNVVSLKEYIERALSARAANDADFIVQAVVDPDAVVKPMIAEMLGDDGGIGLENVSATIHFETSDHLHFVVTLPAPEPEVVGFAAGGFDIAGGLRLGTISVEDLGGGPLFGRKTNSTKKCCTVSDPCHTSAEAGCTL